MKKTYEIAGMSCGGCVNSVKKLLQQHPDIIEADVQLNPPTAVLTMSNPIALEKLQEQLSQSGNFTIADAV